MKPLLTVGLAFGALWTVSPAVSAAAQEPVPATVQTESRESGAPAKVKTDVPSQKRSVWEVQLEYLDARFFANRHVDSYNVHFFKRASKHRAFSIHWGLTVSRPLGYISKHGYHEDSQAFGLGPAILFRWTQKISGKLSAAWDASGSLMFYNHAHPAHGRAYGFLWRTGPRLIWNYDDDNAISLGWSYAHSSNGMRSHNPGYNGVGFSLGFHHAF